VHGDLAAAAQGQSRRGRHHGLGKVFHPHIGILETRNHRLQDIPIAHLDEEQDLEDVGAGGEIGAVVPHHQADEVFLDHFATLVDQLDDHIVQGVHLRMELQAGHAVADIHQRGAGISGDHHLALLQGGQEDDSGVLADLHVILRFKVVVVGPVFLLDVEGFDAFLQHLLDLLGDLLLHLLHDLDGFLHPYGIPGLEGTQGMVVSPLHGVVDGGDILADLRHPIGRIDEVVAEVFPDQFRGRVLAVEDRLDRGSHALVGFFLRRAHRFELGPAGGYVFHLFVVQHELGFLALGILRLLVEAALGLVAQPLELHHLVHEGQGQEGLPGLIVRHRLVEVLHDVVASIQADQVQGPEDGTAGTAHGLADHRVHLVDLQPLLHHEPHGVGDVEHTDPVAHKVGNVLADHNALAKDPLPERDHVVYHFLLRLFPRNDLQELHIAGRIEEVGAQEPLFKRLAEFGADIRDGQARGVRRYDTGRFYNLLHLRE